MTNYDNWERLLTAVLRKERDKELAMLPSISTTSSTYIDQSLISPNSQCDDDQSVTVHAQTASHQLVMQRSFRTLNPTNMKLLYANQKQAVAAGTSSTSQFDDDDQSSRLVHPLQELSLQDSVVTLDISVLPLDKHDVVLTSDSMIHSIEKRSGKKCYMIGARNLYITWGWDPRYWEWTSHADSRFSEVAHLKNVCWFDIQCNIKSQMLSPNTIYGAYLVFKLEQPVYGLYSLSAVVKFVDHETDADAKERAGVVHLHRAEDNSGQQLPGRLPVMRVDGWMEIEIGNFYNDHGDVGEVDARLVEVWRLNWKSGLIVEGIEFRPAYTLNTFIMKRKNVVENNTRGRTHFKVGG